MAQRVGIPIRLGLARIPALILCAFLLLAMPGEASPYTYLPLEHWAYGALERLAALGLVPTHLLAAKPLMREEVARLVLLARSAEGYDRLGSLDRDLLDALAREFAPELAGIRGSPPSLSPYAAGAVVRAGSVPTLTTHPSLRPDSTATTNLAMRFGPISLDAELDITRPSLRRGALSTALGPVRLELGREELWWGPGARGALLISNSAGPLDMLKLTWNTSDIRFTKIAAPLDPPGRYLFGTRLDWRISPSIRIALSETAVALPDPVPLYPLLNPIPVVLTDLLGAWMWGTDNYLVSVDFDVRLRPGFVFYGDVMYDDILSWQPLLEGIFLFPSPPEQVQVLSRGVPRRSRARTTSQSSQPTGSPPLRRPRYGRP